MFGDIIDTGGSILGAAQRLQNEGALNLELRCPTVFQWRRDTAVPSGG